MGGAEQSGRVGGESGIRARAYKLCDLLQASVREEVRVLEAERSCHWAGWGPSSFQSGDREDGGFEKPSWPHCAERGEATGSRRDRNITQERPSARVRAQKEGEKRVRVG